jgi:outer membrane lipoprotein-sorting protein
MKKLLLFLAALVLATPAFASVGAVNQNQSGSEGIATDMLYNCPSGTQLSWNNSQFYLNCGNLMNAGTAGGGLTSLATIDTGIPTSYDIVKKAISNLGTATDTLANGVPGQMLTINITTVTGSGTWVVTPTTRTGFGSITFNTANQTVVLLYLNNTNGWIIHSVYGSTLPTITQAN